MSRTCDNETRTRKGVNMGRHVFSIRLSEAERAAVALAAARLDCDTGTLVRRAAVAVAAELIAEHDTKGGKNAQTHQG